MAYFWTQNDQSLSALVGLKILSRTDVQFFVHLWSVALPDFRGSIGYHCPPITVPSFRIHPFSDSASVRSPVLMLKFVHFFMFLFFSTFWVVKFQSIIAVCLFTTNVDGKTVWFSGTFFIFPYIGNNNPNWRTPSFFQRGRSTTNQIYVILIWLMIIDYHRFTIDLP